MVGKITLQCPIDHRPGKRYPSNSKPLSFFSVFFDIFILSQFSLSLSLSLQLQTQLKKKETNRKAMASCSIASAASTFVPAPNVTSNTNTNYRSSSLLFFPSKNNAINTRLVVRASEEAAPAAAAPAATAPAEGEGEAPAPKAAKPPPIGPKRGTKVTNYNY